MFIDLCGIDGCGKSTTAKALQCVFINKGYDCVIFHGYKPRKTMNLLRDVCIKAGIGYNDASFLNSLGMAACLMDIFNNMNKINIDSSEKVLIAEKYIKDSVVYMPLLGGSYKLARMYEDNLPRPDFRFILDLDARIARIRIENRSILTGKLITEKESLEISLEARKRFLEFSNEPNTYVLDANCTTKEIITSIILIVERQTDNIKPIFSLSSN